jgi:hypothetical protein
MIRTRRILARVARNAALAFAAGCAIGVPVGVGAAGTARTFEGRVEHISTGSIDVRGREGGTTQERRFLIVPRFRGVFHADGKTTARMNDIRTGDLVTVVYDRRLLGARHAETIVDKTSHAGITHMKS